MSKVICNNCGKELPKDSKFCQFCGSDDISGKESEIENRSPSRIELKTDEAINNSYNTAAEVTKDFTNTVNSKGYSSNKKQGDIFKTLFIVALLGMIGLGYGMYCNYRVAMNNYEKISKLQSSLAKSESELSNALTSVTSYKSKADYYDSIVKSASNSSNTNFFASNTVLKNPNKTRVVFYIATNNEYYINWEYENGITITSGNTSNGLVYIDVTYSGSGVRKITCTNTINNQKITIYCVGK